ncbi:MAG: Type toxin-antitoxin system HicB family antitoxin [Herbinix sp.]|jgi:predicted RNase H-like HicB family nuclease|nr:Type toxin-antitoxin system HicB family antitoxin [Herbinix sp.]
MSVKVTVIIQKEDDWYVARCAENNIASQGKSVEEAITNLTEALQLYFEDDANITEHPQTLVTTLEVSI